MVYSARRFSALLLALFLVGSLVACSSTNSSSGASRATTSSVPSETEQQQADTTSEDSAEATELAGTSADTKESAPTTMPAQQYDEVPDGVATGATQQTAPIDGVAEFPEQRYEIEDTPEDAADADADAEIDRLRRELAATESELDRMRDEAMQPDDTTGETGTADSDAASDGEDQQDAYADQSVASGSSPDDASVTAPTGTGAETDTGRAGVINEEMDVGGKPAEFSIYFDYDQTGIGRQFEPVIVAHAKFLKANPQLKAEVQGNCDERGSREYNIALGQRRAESVKRALELLGVDGHRIATVSFGAEKPVAFGRDEESWALNRRADIVY